MSNESCEPRVLVLTEINPECRYRPDGFDRNAALDKARELRDLIRADFPENDVLWDEEVQDATYHAGISVLPYCVEIRLSNFEQLATITNEEMLPVTVLSRLVAFIEQAGYIWVPFHAFGEPFGFGTRRSNSNDPFTQLFDYV